MTPFTRTFFFLRCFMILLTMFYGQHLWKISFLTCSFLISIAKIVWYVAFLLCMKFLLTIHLAMSCGLVCIHCVLIGLFCFVNSWLPNSGGQVEIEYMACLIISSLLLLRSFPLTAICQCKTWRRWFQKQMVISPILSPLNKDTAGLLKKALPISEDQLKPRSMR